MSPITPPRLPGLPRMRTIATAAIVLGIAVGVYFADLFKGFGSGFGIGQSGVTGKSDTAADSDTTAADNKERRSTSNTVPAVDLGNSATTPSAMVADQLPIGPTTAAEALRDRQGTFLPSLRLILDERQYYVWTQEGRELPISVDEIVRYAQLAVGDEDGVRLKIYRRRTARAKAEELLMQSLHVASVPESSVYWPLEPLSHK